MVQQPRGKAVTREELDAKRIMFALGAAPTQAEFDEIVREAGARPHQIPDEKLRIAMAMYYLSEGEDDSLIQEYWNATDEKTWAATVLPTRTLRAVTNMAKMTENDHKLLSTRSKRTLPLRRQFGHFGIYAPDA